MKVSLFHPEEDFVILASAARSASTPSAAFDNHHARGIFLWVDYTVRPGVETITPQIEVYNPTSDEWMAITAFAAFGAVGNYGLTLYPGAVETAALANHEVMGLPLPLGRYRVNVTHSAAGAHTYSIRGKYIH